MSLARTLRTVRHLRPVQLTDRLRRRLRRTPTLAAEHTRAGLHSRPPVLPLRTPHRQAWHEGGFRFLDRRITFEGQDRWAPREASALWRYHLHGFQYLHTLDASLARRLILDWIGNQPPGVSPAWDPYPISIRLREWTEWILGHPDLEREEQRRILTSIGHQADALHRQLEYHLLANHLLENAVTLCWIGTSLNGPLADRLARAGSELLTAELDEQLLADGTHYERSPMYQSLLAEALLRLARVASSRDTGVAQRIAAAAAAAGRRLTDSLTRLSHPDGDIALFNDSALEIAPTAAGLRAAFPELASRTAPTAGGPAGPWQLCEAGAMGWSDGAGTALLLDAGPLGPDYQPGHGHADTLSFELSLGGQRLVTDSGVYTYDSGPIRSFDRSVAAHNTIELDDVDHAELWAAFRCGRRPRVDPSRLQVEGGRITLTGGYGFGRGLRARHDRRASIDGRRILFEDTVRAPGAHLARARLHLAPGVRTARQSGGIGLFRGRERVAVLRGEGVEWAESRAGYHPSFGREIERTVLVAAFPVEDSARLRWSLELNPEAACASSS